MISLASAFRSKGWISNPRFSRRGDRVAFLHHPVSGSPEGRVLVTDLEGHERTMSTPGDVIAGNEFMHREVLALVQKA